MGSSDDLSCRGNRRPCAHMSAGKSARRSEHAIHVHMGHGIFFTRPEAHLCCWFSAALELPSNGTAQVFAGVHVHIGSRIWATKIFTPCIRWLTSIFRDCALKALGVSEGQNLLEGILSPQRSDVDARLQDLTQKGRTVDCTLKWRCF